MISNYAGLNFFDFPLNILVFISFFYGIFRINFLFLNYIKIKISKEFIFLFFFIGFGFYLFLVYCLIFFEVKYAIYFIYISYILFFIVTFLSLKKIKIKKIKIKKINFEKKLILLFIVIYFFLSSVPVSDADSLSYHSAFGAYLLKYNSTTWLYEAYLMHPDFFVSGFVEILNFIGLVLMCDNFGSLFNFFSLVFICFFILNNFKNNSINFVILSIVSSPILLPMIFSQKIYILPSFILSAIIFNIYKVKKLKTFDEFLILSSMFLILAFKISFLYSTFLIIGYIFYKNKVFYKTLFLSVPGVIIFFIPIIIKNLIFHNDLLPPFTGELLNLNSNYLNVAANFFKDYDLALSAETFLLLPILFLIPHYGQAGSVFISWFNIGKIYGFQFYNFLFCKIIFQKKELLIILILSLLTIILSKNISTRWFLYIFFLLQLLICYENFLINKLFKKIIYFQSILFFSFLLFYCVYSFPTLVSNKYKNLFLLKHAHGYELSLKLENLRNKLKLNYDDKIVYSHRAHYWTNIKDGNLNISNEWLPLVLSKNDKILLNKNFNKYLLDKKIKILVIRKKKNLEKIIKKSVVINCKVKFGEFVANHATRNFFFSGKKEYNWIYFENSNLKECLKSE